MFWEFPLKIQTWSSKDNSWDYTLFQDKEEFIDYMWKQFKVPGEYNLTVELSKKIQEQGLNYTRTAKKANFQGGYYHTYVKNSPQEKKWRETEKDRIKNGVIYDHLFIPPYYHWYINYCPIYDDKKKKTRFGDIWDTDIWYFHYVTLCFLLGRFVGGVKGRQKGFSFKHMALMYWSYSWFEGTINTIGAFEEDLVKKSWRFIETYRNHINRYTPFKRGPIKPKSLEWYERTDLQDGTFVGLNSKLSGVTFKQSPTKDVGGNQTIFNYEEPGVAPTILETLEFLEPAMIKGDGSNGCFIACGSVGNLEDAEGLKEIFYKPADYGFLGIPNIWDDDAGPNDKCCIFISEAYSMIGNDIDRDEYGKKIGGTGLSFIDEAGNSRVQLSLDWIERQKDRKKNSAKKAELKQIAESQKCTSPKQAFAERKVAYFPVPQLRRRQEQIKILQSEKKINPQKGLLYIDNNGKIILGKEHGPEHEYPIKPEWPDKRGCVTIYHWPEENPKKYVYFAGVDTVEADETTTSESIQTVDIFQGQTIVKDENGKILRVEGDKLVATFRGRFNPVDGGNEQAWLLLKMYNAYCYQERSKPNFQSYMKRNGWAEQYLAKEAEVQMYKDVNFYKEKPDAGLYGFVINANNNVWDTFKKIGKEYLFTEYGREVIVDAEGNEKVLKTYTGVDRIEDYWLLEEFIAYAEDKAGRPKKNTDRLVSFLAALTLSKVFQNSHTSVKIEPSENAKKPKQVYSPKPINMLGGYPKKVYNNTKGRKPISMI